MTRLRNFWNKYPAVAFLLPIATFLVMGSFEPKPEDGSWLKSLGIGYSHYPILYTIKIVLTGLAIVVVWPKISQLPLRPTIWGVVIGVVGGGLWIGICSLKMEGPILAALRLEWLQSSATRSAFNPLEQLADHPALAYGFLAVRFVGLVLVIAIAEELFLRGLLVRYFVQDRWWELAFGGTNRLGIALSIVVPMLMHPGEVLAALVWFSLVTWLMLKTKSFGDCVLAHATTNLILGIYVVTSGHWELM